MNDSTKQKVITTVIGIPVIIWGLNNTFSQKGNYRSGDVDVDEKVSVFERLRGDERVEIAPDPLDEPLQIEEPSIKIASNLAQQSRTISRPPQPLIVEDNPSQIECTPNMWALGECDEVTQESQPATEKPKSDNISDRPPITTPINRSVAKTPNTGSNSRPHSTPPSKEDMWASLKSDKIETIDGVQANNTGPMVKSHCRMLGLIQDSVVVSDAGRNEVVTLSIKGPMPGCRMPDIRGFKIGAQARISPNKKWVTAGITTCTDPNPRRPSVPCKGVVQSITGEDVLKGEIYDKSFFGALLEVAINTAGIYMLKDLALASSQVDNVWAANTNAQIVTSFQAAIAQGAANIRKTFSGREIHLAPGAPVIVTFTEDVSL